MSLRPEELEALQRLLERSGASVRIDSTTQLTGGASRQTFGIETTGGAGGYILQRELSPEPRLPSGMADEAMLVTAAYEVGVPAPVVVGTNLDGEPDIGTSYFVSKKVDGETIARRILRDESYSEARSALPAQLGKALAALHGGVTPEQIPWLEQSDELAKYREIADELDLVSPAFELGFRWLAANKPDPAKTRRTVVHGDFRLGNLIVDETGLAAVIDWELGHIGDPMEDLGWVCVRAWRFGGDRPVAGVGEYEDFFTAYEQASGTAVDRAAVTWWETLGTLKWGVMCGTQSNRHLSGDVPSVELAAIGPRVAEQEYDVLRLIEPSLITGSAQSRAPERAKGNGSELATGLAEGGGRPTGAELLDAVRRFLTDDVMGETSGKTGFHVRVAANALAIVERELEFGPALQANRAQRLARLGVDDERSLAEAIRSGAFDGRLQEVTAAVYGSVVDRLTVNNPRWLHG